MSVFTIYNYTSDRQVPRNKIFLPKNLITFLEEGEKSVYYADNKTSIKNDQFAILSSGNCLMTEKLPSDNAYKSTMLFFDNSALMNFFVKYAAIIDKISTSTNTTQKPFVVLPKDEFIRNYIASLQLIQLKPASFTEKIIELKFEELMLHLLEMHPAQVLSFQNIKQEEHSDFEIRKAVEMNITNNLTLEELAFLCHTSISTFKRKFVKLYNETPSHYFLQQKMEIAKSLLLKNENPSEVFYKVGYENHSSFSQSFKQVYGISPKQFQQQNLDAPQQFLND